MASANLLKADVYSEYFPNPLLSFIGTNQIGDCAAYPRPAQNRVHKIKLATAFVFGVDVGARRFRLGTLQILPNHGKSILATDGMKLKSRIPARPHGRALRGGCGATSLAVPATIPLPCSPNRSLLRQAAHGSPHPSRPTGLWQISRSCGNFLSFAPLPPR